MSIPTLDNNNMSITDNRHGYEVQKLHWTLIYGCFETDMADVGMEKQPSGTDDDEKSKQENENDGGN